MLLSPTFVNPISISISISISFAPTINRRVSIGLRFKRRASFVANLSPSFSDRNKPSVHYHTLRVLEWDKLCDSVASFARTSLGRQATKAPNLSPINYFSQQFKFFFFWILSFWICCWWWNRSNSGLWIRITRKVWGFWTRPMLLSRLSSTVVVRWISPALMSFWFVQNP